MNRRKFNSLLLGGGALASSSQLHAQAPKFQPTWDSLEKHSVPDWFQDAKFGIFIHWGLYSVPASSTTARMLGSSAPAAVSQNGSNLVIQSKGKLPESYALAVKLTPAPQNLA